MSRRGATPVAVHLAMGALAGLMGLGPAMQGRRSEPAVREIFVPQISYFTTQHPGVADSFDLSPDGRTLAVEIGTQERDGTFGEWITLWDVATGDLYAAKQVERNYPTWRGVPWWQYETDVRFSPDGHTLVVLTGPRLMALNLPDLKVLYTLEARVLPQRPDQGMFILAFSMAMAADRVAVLYGHRGGRDNSARIDLLNLRTGQPLRRWSEPGFVTSLALSPDGTLIAMVMNPVWGGVRNIPAGRNDVFLRDCATGKVVRALNTGYAAGDAQFLGGDSKLVTIPAMHGDPHFYSRDKIRVWDLATGRVERELGYPRYGVRGNKEVSISPGGRFLAAIARWQNPADLELDRDNPRGWVRLLVWDLRTGELVFVSDDLQGPSGAVLGERFMARFAAAVDRLAAGHQFISVYSVGEGPQGAGKSAAPR